MIIPQHSMASVVLAGQIWIAAYLSLFLHLPPRQAAFGACTYQAGAGADLEMSRAALELPERSGFVPLSKTNMFNVHRGSKLSVNELGPPAD